MARPISATQEETDCLKERTAYDGHFHAESEAVYDAIYVAIDTHPRVNHRKFEENPDGYAYVFFDSPDREEKAVRFRKTGRTIEWTVGVGNVVNPAIKDVMERVVRGEIR